MKSVVQSEQENRSDYFAFFKKTTIEAFSFLAAEYAFHIASIFDQMPECAIEYRNETTAVIITYEWESELWLVLKPLKPVPGRAGKSEGIGLDFLIRLRCPEKAEPDRGAKRWARTAIKRQLFHYAAALKECATDILAGDFRVFPEVKRLQDIAKQKRDRALYGSRKRRSK